MHIDKIDKYFAERGTKVIYNCLGHTEDLIRSYVKNFQTLVDNSKRKKSQYVKASCYTSMYEIDSRLKFTGFEQYKKIDREFRKNISSLIHEAQFSPTLIVDPKENEVNSDYKIELKKFVSNIDNPLLYLSGGIDSELVAVAMLDSDKKFTPVIFQYTNNLGQVVNLFDTNYAIKFCGDNGLFPIIKTINIEELWQSTEFEKLAIDLQIVSPHIVTHAYMVEMMKYQFPDHTHVFGGEVRFYTYHQLDDGRMANLALLAKTIPGYSGGSYSASSFTGPQSADQFLDYSNDGSWSISGDGNLGWMNDSGTWTTTPGSTYQVRVVSAAGSNLFGTYAYTGQFGTPTAWTTIGASTRVCEANANPFSPASTLIAEFTIEVRTASGAQTGIIQTSIVEFNCEYNA